MKLKLLRLSASRPECLRTSTTALYDRSRMIFSGEFEQILHEDFLINKKSQEILHWAKYSGLFFEIHFHKKAIGTGQSLDFLLNRVGEDEFCLNWEDDWDIVQPINLDKALELIKKYKAINQIAWHKREIGAWRHDWKKEEVVYDDMKLTTNPHWAFTPALWRMSFIKKYWIKPPRMTETVWWLNDRIKGTEYGEPARSAQWVIANSGTYFFGGIGTSAYINHLGIKSARKGEILEGV